MEDAVRFVDDEALGYRRAATSFTAGQGLRLDDSYRLCHLPLVNPTHRDVIAHDVGRGYAMGRHGDVRSLVAPINADHLDASPQFAALSADLAGSPITSKIAWHIVPHRRGKLHATLSAVGEGDGWRAALRAIGPVRVRIGGPFSGNINVGRIYLRLYPEQRGGLNLFRAVQDALGQPRRDLYLVGLWNLTDHLNAAETAWLAGWLARWGGATLGEVTLEALHVLVSSDDLALQSRVDEAVALT